MKRTGRHMTLAIAILALTLASIGSTASAARLRNYWTTDAETSRTMPNGPTDKNWDSEDPIDPVPIVVEPGGTVWLAFRNGEPKRGPSKFVNLTLTTVSGPVRQLSIFAADGYMTSTDARPTRLPGQGYFFNGEDEQRYGYGFKGECPKWERFTIVNNSAEQIAFWAARVPWCARVRPKAAWSLAFEGAAFGAEGAMIDTSNLRRVMIAPLFGGVDELQPPKLCMPPDTGPWEVPGILPNDPFGNPLPGGAWEWTTPQQGLREGQSFNFELPTLGPDGSYLMWAFDANRDEWEFYFIDLGHPWIEPFDPLFYQPGQGALGARGWETWNHDPAFDGIIAPFPQLSPPFSLDVQNQTDLVRPLLVEDGVWMFQWWTFVPPNFQQPPSQDPYAGQHIRIYNTYEDGGPFHWSVDIQFDARDQQARFYVGNGNETIDVPYLVDQWVPIDVVVDLDNDHTQVFYDQQPIVEFQWTAGFDGSGGGQPEIAAIELFAQGSSSIFYDDLMFVPRLGPPCPGDIDGDGEVGFGDILAVLSNWGPCACCPEDADGDGEVGFGDILAVLSNWGPCPR